MMQIMSYSVRRFTTGLTLEIQPVCLQMSDKEIIEWFSNYNRVDEISRAFSREHLAQKSDRQSVAWKVDQRAREVRVRENEGSDSESQGRPDRNEWRKEAECFACCQKGHIQSDPECPYRSKNSAAKGGQGKEKGKGKGKGKGGPGRGRNNW